MADTNARQDGDHISLGNITNSIGVAIGRNARAVVNIFEQQANSFERQNELALLAKMQTIWIDGVYTQSVFENSHIQLNKKWSSALVDGSWDDVLGAHDKSSSSDSAYDLNNYLMIPGRSLLILGEPGSGKTTLLLELTAHNILLAQDDAARALPVVLNLSSWGSNKLPIEDWAVLELNRRYHIPNTIARNWVDTSRLMFFLDGLDEVAKGRQSECVKAINDFRKTHGFTSLVVCSRIQEYQAIDIKLILDHSVTIQPLTLMQIEHFIRMKSGSLSGLKEAIVQDADLSHIAKSPLMLSVMSQVYEGLQASQIIGHGHERPSLSDHLFEAYVNKMFQRTARTQIKEFSESQSRKYLYRLAQNMNQHNLSIFMLEDIQPSWLDRPWQIALYSLMSRIMGGMSIGIVYAFLTVFVSRRQIDEQNVLWPVVLFCIIVRVVPQ